MIETILVPTDGSEHARKAVGFAADLAEKYGARLLLLHVMLQEPVSDDMLRWARVEHLVEDEPGGDGAMATGYGRFGQLLSEAPRVPSTRVLTALGEAVLDHANRVARDSGATQVEEMMLPGDATQTILKVARDKNVDLIVMGSRGLSDFRGLLQGSVSHKVSGMAPCTVITVR